MTAVIHPSTQRAPIRIKRAAYRVRFPCSVTAIHPFGTLCHSGGRVGRMMAVTLFFGASFYHKMMLITLFFVLCHVNALVCSDDPPVYSVLAV